MTEEHNQMPSTGDRSTGNRLYTAEVSQDPALNTTIISLTSFDQSNSSRNTQVSIAPEFGSNLFRFRAGEHDLIYTDQELLTKRDFTGMFVLWPFPNRVRDKRYTYQGQRYSLEDVRRPGGYPTLVHGLVFDRPWHYMQPVIGTDAVSVTTYVDVNKVMYAMYDLREPVPVDFLKLDHVYMRLNKPSFSIVDYKTLALQLHISATDDFTHLVIFTPEQVPSLCIEHQTCSTDAINLHHQGAALREAAHLLEVQPGETYSGA